MRRHRLQNSVLVSDSRRRSVVGRRILKYLLFSIILSIGCGTVPDVQPFAVQCRALEQQYHIVARDVTAEVKSIDPKVGADFETRLDERATLLTAIRIYSDELVTLADVARPGSAGAAHLTDALSKLASQFRQTLPGPYTAIAAEVLDAVENARASKSLADSIREADPAIRDLAVILAREMQPLRDLTRQSKYLVVRSAKNRYKELIDRFSEATNARHALIAQCKEIRDQLDKPGQRSEDVEKALASVNARLLLVDNWLQEIQSHEDWPKYQEDMRRIETRYDALLNVMSEVEVALEAWAASHAQIAQVVRDRRQIDVGMLANHTANLSRLISEVRNK